MVERDYMEDATTIAPTAATTSGSGSSINTASTSSNKGRLTRSGNSTVTPGPLPTPSSTRAEQAEAMEKQKQDADGDPECPLCESNAPPAREPGTGAEASSASTSKGRRKSSGPEAVQWVSCDKCETWYHWICTAANPSDSLDLVDQWFCPPCIKANSNLKPTMRPAPRKSSRPSSRLDYANLDSHLPADASRFLKVVDSRTRSIKEAQFPRFKDGDEWRKAWWSGEGDEWGNLGGEEGEGKEVMREPVVIESEEGLGLKMPSNDIGIQEIAKRVGGETPIEVIDVASQSTLVRWTLQQWADYYTSPTRDKVRNVISLEVSESELASEVDAPKLVRELDWVETIWPKELDGPGQIPRVQKYCLMSVKQCWTDWHIDFAGSSVYYHILRGSKVFYFIKPTEANLAAYETWSGSAERQENTWLGDSVDAVYKIELTQGNTMIIPTGWIHAVFTPLDSLVIGGNFLHSLDIATQLRIYQIELNTKVPKKFRFPHFVKMLWFVARHYHAILNSSSASSEAAPLHSTPAVVPQTDEQQLAEPQASVDSATSADPSPTVPPTTATSTSPKSPSPPQLLSNRILQGLLVLSTFLDEQITRLPKDSKVSNERRRVARENVPWDWVKDPEVLAKEFGVAVRRALGIKEEVVEVKKQGEKGVGKKVEKVKRERKRSPVKKGVQGPAAAGGKSNEAGTEPQPVEGQDLKVVGNGVNGDKAKVPAKRKVGEGGDGAAVPETGAARPAKIAKIKEPKLPKEPKELKKLKDDGVIVSKRVVPAQPVLRHELRVDPARPEEKPRTAEVKDTQSTNEVVRRHVEEDGSVVVETRTVITKVERVKWAPLAGPNPSPLFPPTLKATADSTATPHSSYNASGPISHVAQGTHWSPPPPRWSPPSVAAHRADHIPPVYHRSPISGQHSHPGNMPRPTVPHHHYHTSPPGSIPYASDPHYRPHPSPPVPLPGRRPSSGVFPSVPHDSSASMSQPAPYPSVLPPPLGVLFPHFSSPNPTMPPHGGRPPPGGGPPPEMYEGRRESYPLPPPGPPGPPPRVDPYLHPQNGGYDHARMEY